jgi:hypothetical protein
MPNVPGRILLYCSSYLPLLVILLLWYWDTDPLLSLGLAACGVLVLAVLWWYFGRVIPSMSAAPVMLLDVSGRAGDVAGYLITYILSLWLLVVGTASWRQLVATILIFVLVGYIYVRSRLLYLNPTLTLLFRLELYDVVIEGRQGHFALLAYHRPTDRQVPLEVIDIGGGILVEKRRKGAQP